jgi:hypothetical protein
MILIEKKADHTIFSKRQANDWKNKQRLADLEQEYSELPGNTPPDVLQRYLDAIQDLKDERDFWNNRMIGHIVDTYGGLYSEYAVVPVPEDEVLQARTAVYISYNGETLAYETGSIIIDAGVLTISGPRWVGGKYVLETDDSTDFNDLAPSEDTYFKLAAYRTGHVVSIELFTWTEGEDCADMELSGKVWLSTICAGIVHDDLTITLI